MDVAVSGESGAATMSPRRRLALLILAAAHLGLAAMGGVDMHLPGTGWMKRAISEYRTLSGTNVYYTFFVPGVATQVRPVFELTDRSGRVTTDALSRAVGSEVGVRLGNLTALLDFSDDDSQRELLASWAGVMFARHPDAERVVIGIEAFELPSMEEHRKGRPPGWHLRDRFTFSPQTAIRPAGNEANEASR
jgi:hypothetical protein